MKKALVPKELYRWVNCWAEEEKHELNKDERSGYRTAIQDILKRMECPNAYPLNDNEEQRGFTD